MATTKRGIVSWSQFRTGYCIRAQNNEYIDEHFQEAPYEQLGLVIIKRGLWRTYHKTNWMSTSQQYASNQIDYIANSSRFRMCVTIPRYGGSIDGHLPSFTYFIRCFQRAWRVSSRHSSYRPIGKKYLARRTAASNSPSENIDWHSVATKWYFLRRYSGIGLNP